MSVTPAQNVTECFMILTTFATLGRRSPCNSANYSMQPATRNIMSPTWSQEGMSLVPSLLLRALSLSPLKYGMPRPRLWSLVHSLNSVRRQDLTMNLTPSLGGATPSLVIIIWYFWQICICLLRLLMMGSWEYLSFPRRLISHALESLLGLVRPSPPSVITMTLVVCSS